MTGKIIGKILKKSVRLTPKKTFSKVAAGNIPLAKIKISQAAISPITNEVIKSFLLNFVCSFIYLYVCHPERSEGSPARATPKASARRAYAGLRCPTFPPSPRLWRADVGDSSAYGLRMTKIVHLIIFFKFADLLAQPLFSLFPIFPFPLNFSPGHILAAPVFLSSGSFPNHLFSADKLGY